MKKIFKLISVFILLLAVNNVFAGGGKRTGTAGASELLIPVGPRGIAWANQTWLLLQVLEHFSGILLVYLICRTMPMYCSLICLI